MKRRKSAISECRKIGISTPAIFYAEEASFYKNVPYHIFDEEIHKIQRFNKNTFAHKNNFIRCLQDAKEKEHDSILFLEDDVCFDEQEIDNLNRCMSELPADYDVFSLGAYHFEKPSVFSQNLVKVNGCWFLHAVLINKSGIEKIIQLLEKNEFRTADLTIGMVRYLNNGLNYYAPVTTIAYQKPFYSSLTKQIETKDIPKNAFDCKPILVYEIFQEQENGRK